MKKSLKILTAIVITIIIINLLFACSSNNKVLIISRESTYFNIVIFKITFETELQYLMLYYNDKEIQTTADIYKNGIKERDLLGIIFKDDLVYIIMSRRSVAKGDIIRAEYKTFKSNKENIYLYKVRWIKNVG